MATLADQGPFHHFRIIVPLSFHRKTPFMKSHSGFLAYFLLVFLDGLDVVGTKVLGIV